MLIVYDMMPSSSYELSLLNQNNSSSRRIASVNVAWEKLQLRGFLQPRMHFSFHKHQPHKPLLLKVKTHRVFAQTSYRSDHDDPTWAASFLCPSLVRLRRQERKAHAIDG